jgi:exodeoxyribonuclease-3
MKLITFNVNGIRAINRKQGLQTLIQNHSPDVICLQEIRCSEEHVDTCLRQPFQAEYPYMVYSCHSKKGYAGVAILSKIPFDEQFLVPYLHPIFEGRINIVRLVNGIIVLNAYVMNSQGRNTERWQERTGVWDVMFTHLVKALPTPLIVCGDMNVINRDCDCHPSLYSPDAPAVNAEERQGFVNLLENSNLFDVIPEESPNYTWFSYVAKCREMKLGMRIDYVLVSSELTKGSTNVLYDINGSDHIPVMYTIT